MVAARAWTLTGLVVAIGETEAFRDLFEVWCRIWGVGVSRAEAELGTGGISVFFSFSFKLGLDEGLGDLEERRDEGFSATGDVTGLFTGVGAGAVARFVVPFGSGKPCMFGRAVSGASGSPSCAAVKGDGGMTVTLGFTLSVSEMEFALMPVTSTLEVEFSREERSDLDAVYSD